MGVFVNRILNMKKIKAIGLDMDHTIVRYNAEKFEALTFSELVKKLVALKKYPAEIQQIPFEYQRAIRGLVIDKKLGNLVKLSLYGRVKQAYHGHTLLDFNTLKQDYHGMVIDLNDPHFRCIDTSFSIGEGALFSGLVHFKDTHPELNLPSYEDLASDIQAVLDISHRDGSLKGVVAQKLSEYIIQDPMIPQVLLRFKEAGKTLVLITNSDFHYTKLLLDYTFNPFLEGQGKVKNWGELFDYVITLAEKPSFFTLKRPFLLVNPEDGSLNNYWGPIRPGIYQGGSASAFQQNLRLSGEDILYIGDHIYGDILQLKKLCNWRTALVVEEIKEEVTSLKLASPVSRQLDQLMTRKETLEIKLNTLLDKKKTDPAAKVQKQIDEAISEISSLNEILSPLIFDYQKCFNPYWGEIMRAGQEESRLMGQVAKYACIYMASIADFAEYTPRHYYRPKRRPLPHED